VVIGGMGSIMGSIVTGFARYKEEPVLVVGHHKGGGDTKQKIYRNFGYAKPEGYRKALRAMKLAEKYQRAVIAFIDTPAAYPGIESEERGISEAIAVISDSRNFFEGRPDPNSRFAQNGLLAETQGSVQLVDDCSWLWTNSTITAHMCGITVRRTAVVQLGPRLFAEDLSCCEDWEFQMRLYSLGQVAVLPEIYSSVRRFDDGSRLGRGIPGQGFTREQEIDLLRARLTVMERAKTWLHDLRADRAAELKRFYNETEERLSQLTAKVMTA